MNLPSFLPSITPGLYLVGVPIGNRGDITLRALHTLTYVDLIYCEDTRHSRPLLETYTISKPLKTYHEHNGERARPEILKFLQEGKAIALISDAGMPLISDPGFKLVRACREAGHMITCVPGPSATLTALVLSGLPTDKFYFGGFANPKIFSQVSDYPCTLIFFESPHRLLDTLTTIEKTFPNRKVSILRELTKKFEEVILGLPQEIAHHFAQRDKIKGEIVIVLSPPQEDFTAPSSDEVISLLQEALKKYRLKDACKLVAQTYGLSSKDIYKKALNLKATPEKPPEGP